VENLCPEKGAFLLVEKNCPIRARTNGPAISEFYTHPIRIEKKLSTKFLIADGLIRFPDPENLWSNFIKYRYFLKIPYPQVRKFSTKFLDRWWSHSIPRPRKPWVKLFVVLENLWVPS
jgi:hypothetical protein